MNCTDREMRPNKALPVKATQWKEVSGFLKPQQGRSSRKVGEEEEEAMGRGMRISVTEWCLLCIRSSSLRYYHFHSHYPHYPPLLYNVLSSLPSRHQQFIRPAHSLRPRNGGAVVVAAAIWVGLWPVSVAMTTPLSICLSASHYGYHFGPHAYNNTRLCY